MTTRRNPANLAGYTEVKKGFIMDNIAITEICESCFKTVREDTISQEQIDLGGYQVHIVLCEDCRS